MNHIHNLIELKFWAINLFLIGISFATTEAVLRIMILLASLIYTVLKIINESKAKKNESTEKKNKDREAQD